MKSILLIGLGRFGRHIAMKLDENERGNLTRLMKTKEMLANK